MISVLVPAYNVEAYIENCIRAILGQTLSELEVIVVDDGSTDHTSGILDHLQAGDERLRVIHQENAGVAAARNRLIREANGDLIAFVDSDDLIHPRYLQTLYEGAVQNGCRISKLGYHDVEGFETFVQPPQPVTFEMHATRDYLLGRKDAFTLWTFLFSRCLWEDISFPSCRVAEDTAVLYKLLYKEKDIAVAMADEMYQHLVREDGLIGDGQFSLKLLDRLNVFEERYFFYKEKDEPELTRYALLSYAMELLNDNVAIEKIGEKSYRKNIRDRYISIYREAIVDAASNRQRLLFGIARLFPGIWELLNTDKGDRN